MPQMLQDKHSGGRRQSPDLPEDLLHYASRPTGSPDSAADGISLHRARMPAQPTLHKGSDEGELSISHVGAPTRGCTGATSPKSSACWGPVHLHLHHLAQGPAALQQSTKPLPAPAPQATCHKAQHPSLHLGITYRTGCGHRSSTGTALADSVRDAEVRHMPWRSHPSLQPQILDGVTAVTWGSQPQKQKVCWR